MGQKWEYLVAALALGGVPPVGELNKLGKERWELISTDNGVYIFKRQLFPAERGRLGTV